MADRHTRRQHRQLERRFSASFPQRSSFSRFFCFFKKEEKWNKNYSLVSFFFSVCQNFQEEMEILYRNADMKNRGLKSCHYSLRLEFESCVCHMVGRTPPSDEVKPGLRAYLAGLIAPFGEQFICVGLYLVLLLSYVLLFSSPFSST